MHSEACSRAPVEVMRLKPNVSDWGMRGTMLKSVCSAAFYQTKGSFSVLQYHGYAKSVTQRIISLGITICLTGS